MPLLVMERAKLKVIAVIEESPAYDGTSEALTFLQNAMKGAQYAGSARGFKALFVRYAEGQRLPAENFHEANKEKQVWEFIKGDLRIYCYKDSAGNVILSHGIIKKKQKADEADVNRVCTLRDRLGQTTL